MSEIPIRAHGVNFYQNRETKLLNLVINRAYRGTSKEKSNDGLNSCESLQMPCRATCKRYFCDNLIKTGDYFCFI